jgi:hypothetical protein
MEETLPQVYKQRVDTFSISFQGEWKSPQHHSATARQNSGGVATSTSTRPGITSHSPLPSSPPLPRTLASAATPPSLSPG